MASASGSDVEGVPQLVRRFLEPSHRDQVVDRVPVMRGWIGRLQTDRFLVVLLRLRPRPAVNRPHAAAACIRLGWVGVDLEGSVERGLRAGHHVRGRQRAVGAERDVGVGHAGIRLGVRRIPLDGSREARHALFQLVFGSLVPVIPSFEIEAVGLEIPAPLRHGRNMAIRGQPALECVHDGTGDLLLHREDVLQ
jgi:hypothetical protein